MLGYMTLNPTLPKRSLLPRTFSTVVCDPLNPPLHHSFYKTKLHILWCFHDFNINIIKALIRMLIGMNSNPRTGSSAWLFGAYIFFKFIQWARCKHQELFERLTSCCLHLDRWTDSNNMQAPKSHEEDPNSQTQHRRPFGFNGSGTLNDSLGSQPNTTY